MQTIKKSFFTFWSFIGLIILATILLANTIEATENKLNEAIALHNAGRDGNTQATADAISLLEDITTSEPKNVEAIAYLGSSYAITARDSKTVVDKIRYTNRGLRFLDQAVNLEPDNFTARIVRANVTNSLPSMFSRKETAIEDGLVLDKMFSAMKSPKMAISMVDIYEMLSEIAAEQGDWTNKADEARKLAESR